MPVAFFQMLRERGLLSLGRISRDRATRLTLHDIDEISQLSTEMFALPEAEMASTAYDHSATISLGGGRYPCAGLQCRRKKVDQLARFAALYSDRTYISNFLSGWHRHLSHIDSIDKFDRSFINERFFEDLQILQSLRPLIEAGRVVPVTTPNFCPGCLANAIFGNGASTRFRRLEKSLLRRYQSEIEVEMMWSGRLFVVQESGPEELLEHGMVQSIRSEIPPEVAVKKQLVKRLQSGRSLRMSHEMRSQLGIEKHLAGAEFRSLVFEMAMTKSLGTRFLTERPLHVSLLNAMSEDPELAERNSAVMQHLSSFVPFAQDVPISELLRLRRREEESFELFRQALNDAVKNYKRERGTITPAVAQEIYSDVLSPSIRRLEARVKSAKRDLVKGVARKAGAWVGAIAFGFYTGILPHELLPAAQALGLLNIVADLGERGLSGTNASALRSEDTYFLWQVKQLSKGKRA